MFTARKKGPPVTGKITGRVSVIFLLGRMVIVLVRVPRSRLAESVTAVIEAWRSMARLPWAMVLPLLMMVVRMVVFLPGLILVGVVTVVGARSIVGEAT